MVSSFSPFIKWIWLIVVFALVLIFSLFTLILKTQMPETHELENPEMEIATKILADDGRIIGKAFKFNRVWKSFDEINPFVIDALISTEDERFYKHSGIDFRGTLRAMLYLGKRGGASTITQQLAKQFFTKRSRSLPKRLWQKLKEWTIAIQFEKRYTKEEIIAMYLNKYDFLYSSNGISAAAKTYFGKDQSNLTIDEAAILVGMLKNPSLYNPLLNPNNALNRRNIVMKQMVRNHKLDVDRYNKLYTKPIDISNFKREHHYTGIAPYFRSTVIQDVKKILNQNQYSKADGTKYNIYTDGLSIYTTLDLDMQKHAETAMHNHMKKLQNTFFNRWKNKDPWTYKANKKQKEIRLGNLQKQVRESMRFKSLRRKYLTRISQTIEQEIPHARLLDADIFRLFSAEKDNTYLKKPEQKKFISSKQSNTYNKILNSQNWPKLKNAWLQLKEKSKQEFAKKTNMKVFGYNNEGEKSVNMSPIDSIRYHNMHLQIGSVSIHPKTGYIKTWVGGIGHKYFQYDHVKSNRQVGSTFKPFIYGTAIIELAISPCTKVQDIQYVIPAKDPNFNLNQPYSPANASKFTGEFLTFKEGLRRSKNSVSLWLMKEIGNTESVRDFANNLGIEKEKIPNVPSICLGVAQLNTLDLAGAYAAFADDGNYHKPIYLKRIEDKNGKIIFQNRQHIQKAISSPYNYVMVDLLKYAAKSISGWFDSEVGGKSGTTDDYRDGWFVGITPELVSATWVGGELEWIRFDNLQDGQGSAMARPFFTEFLKLLEKDNSTNYDKNAKFRIPEEQIVEMDCEKHDALFPKKDSLDDEIIEEEIEF